MFCKDPFVTLLKNFNYNVVRVPKADLQPLQVLIKEKGNLKPLGDLSKLLISGNQVELPKIKLNTQLAPISGQRTSDMSAGIGISLLGNIIGAMGGSKLGLDATFSQAKTISFEFEDVQEDSIEIVVLDQFLADADVNPLSRFVAELLEADDIYVITATLKSNKITVESKNKNQSGLDVNVPEIKEIVGGSVEITSKGDNTNTLIFQGDIPLSFGFQAVRLVYEDGQYKTFKHLPAGEGAVSIDGQDEPDYLNSESGFINLLGHFN